MNKVFLTGNVGKEPKTGTSQAGKRWMSFSVGEYAGKDKTRWHNVTAFGKTVDYLEPRVQKGSKVFVEGTVDYSEYEKDGVKQYRTSILANNVELGAPAKNSSNAPVEQGDIPF